MESAIALRCTNKDRKDPEVQARLTTLLLGDLIVSGLPETGVPLDLDEIGNEDEDLFAGKKVRCLSTTSVTDAAKYTLLSLQTSLGIYAIRGRAGMVVSFQKGPVLGLIGRIDHDFYVIDVERGVIQRLQPIVGLSNYIRAHHNASLKAVFTIDVLVPTEGDASDFLSLLPGLETAEKSSKGKAAAKAKRKRQTEQPAGTEEGRGLQDDAPVEISDDGAKTVTADGPKKKAPKRAKKNSKTAPKGKEKEKEKEAEDVAKESVSEVVPEKEGVGATETPKKRRRAASKKRKAVKQAVDPFDALVSDVDPSNIRSDTKKRAAKKAATEEN